MPRAGGRFSRRLLLASGAATCLASSLPKGPTFASEWRRYTDQATEFDVLRLTDPAHQALLGAPSNRTITRDSASLLFASDRTGTPQVFLMDLAHGTTRQLTEGEDVDPASIALVRGDRYFCYAAGNTLRISDLGALREREVCRMEDGVSLAGAGYDLANAYTIERHGGSSRLRAYSWQGGKPRTLVETPFAISDPMPRPDLGEILYRQGGEALWLTDTGGRSAKKLPLARGAVGQAGWNPDGRSVLYLSIPEEPGRLNSIREYTPEADTDKLVAQTSQFVSFGFNRDSSVFAGASRNPASPTVLLLLRVTRREMTLCEHRASRPEAVTPRFAPDSQRLYFQSDREGKSAIYAMRVDKLVEKTDGEE